MTARQEPENAKCGLPPVIVSACLLGLRTRYDGTSLQGIVLPGRFGGRILVPVCPEQLGGLPTPRSPQEFRGGSGEEVLGGKACVINKESLDVTGSFIRGAGIVCKIAELTGAEEALLKDGSPSCGVTRVTVDGRETGGLGVTAAALKKLGIAIHTCG